MAKLLQFLISLIQFFDQSSIVEDYYPNSLRAYKPFEFFTLSITWPPSYCLTVACKYKPIPTDFTIHGLWPNNYTSDLLNCYTEEKYKPITQTVLLRRMNKNWPYLQGTGDSQNHQLWAIEWTKHGTCSLSLYTQNQYFTLTLDMRDRYNLLAAFKAKDIVPGDSPYSVQLITTTVTDLTKKVPSLACKTASKKLLLVEVRICFNPQGVVMDCPYRSATCGKGDIYFPK